MSKKKELDVFQNVVAWWLIGSICALVVFVFIALLAGYDLKEGIPGRILDALFFAFGTGFTSCIIVFSTDKDEENESQTPKQNP